MVGRRTRKGKEIKDGKSTTFSDGKKFAVQEREQRNGTSRRRKGILVRNEEESIAGTSGGIAVTGHSHNKDSETNLNFTPEQNNWIQAQIRNLVGQLEEMRVGQDQLPDRSQVQGDNGRQGSEVRVTPVISQGLKLPRGGWLQNPFQEIKFSGRGDPQNPVRFPKKFEKTAGYERIGNEEQLHFFAGCLVGQAVIWWEMQDDLDTIEEAKEAFMRTY